jgi:hypothetical protein
MNNFEKQLLIAPSSGSAISGILLITKQTVTV